MRHSKALSGTAIDSKEAPGTLIKRTMTDEQFIELVEQHRKILYKVASSYCRNPDDRRDLMQEITVQLWQSIHRYDPAQRFSTWMYRVAINVAISFYRTHRTRSERTVPIEGSVLALAAPERESDDLRLLRKFIDQLDELNKALVLLYLDGYPYETIAEVLGISLTNVATKLNRVKERLRRDFNATKEPAHGTR